MMGKTMSTILLVLLSTVMYSLQDRQDPELAYQAVADFIIENAPDIVNIIGSTAFVNAGNQGHRELAILLIKNLPYLDMTNDNGQTALSIAASFGNCELATLLIKHGEDVNLKEIGSGTTALMWAAFGGNPEVVSLLLDHQARVNMQNFKGATALMLAAQRGFTDIAALLIEHKADVHLQDYEGKTALAMAKESFEKSQPTHPIITLLEDGLYSF